MPDTLPGWSGSGSWIFQRPRVELNMTDKKVNEMIPNDTLLSHRSVLSPIVRREVHPAADGSRSRDPQPNTLGRAQKMGRKDWRSQRD